MENEIVNNGMNEDKSELADDLSTQPFGKSFIISDPVYGVMNYGVDNEFNKVLRKIIDTHEFQRLRKISQLGLASFVFPGATHTRFAHSLGVAYLATKILSHLRDRHYAPMCVEDKYKLDQNRYNVVISALLHDIGHGPFSHSFEKVFDTKDIQIDKKYRIDHEDWSSAIISSQESNIRNIVDSCSLLDIDIISAPFNEKPVSRDVYPLYLKQIVSSQLDADRLDYLMRDSLYAGVSLGRVDVDYLIESMCIIEQFSDGPTSWHLGIENKGIKAFEAYLLARQFMNRSVYYHRALKVVEFMMEHFIRLLFKNMDVLSENIKKIVPGYIISLKNYMMDPKDDSSKDGFILEHTKEYLSLTEIDIWKLVEELNKESAVSDLHGMARRIANRDIVMYSVIDKNKETVLDDYIRTHGLESDIDYISNSSVAYKSDKDQMYVSDGARVSKHIDVVSGMISRISDWKQNESLLIYLNSAKARKIYTELTAYGIIEESDKVDEAISNSENK